MKKVIFIVFFLLQSATIFCQEDNWHFTPSVGLSFQKQLVGELGLMYASSSRPGPCDPGGLIGTKLGTEFNFMADNFFLAPKISGEVAFLIFGARLSIIDYTDFVHHDVKLTPEIGISSFGLYNLYYGYNISLTEKRIDNIGTHRITFTFNYDKVLLKD